ncbi:MAG TPA: Gfo/Idh/MocA family oxidoreductase [Bryobacteraceae bacterium]|jgi:predicted dehydrogenase
MIVHPIAILGCGDFLRSQVDFLKNSRTIRVATVYDLDPMRAQKFGQLFGSSVAADPNAIFADNSVHLIAFFIPPWIRKDLFLKAATSGKHVIATKPLAASINDCQEITAAVSRSGIKVGVIYGRTSDPFIEATRDLFISGRFGRLALYRQDWIHAYPQWNNWATDPAKNGGPFMDAMIHNLNAACFLMDRSVEKTAFFSDRLAHPELKCADTEAMILKFAGGGVANLFITWAADLATRSQECNDREHIDLFYLVTDKGWRITKDWQHGSPVIIASREGQQEIISCLPIPITPYDAFTAHLDGGPFPRVLATLDDASRDITLIRGV